MQNYNKSLESIEDAEDFIEWIRETRKVKNSTLQRYLNTLKVISPLFKTIKIKSEPRPLPKPFSVEEVRAIIHWFENHNYYSYYADYVKFLFLTGSRTSEAIGLQWKHIDFERNLMFIYESLGRDRGNSAKRIRKTTKNRKLREFPLSNSLLELLKSRYSASNKSTKSLVFPSPKGKAIDDHNFSQRIWKKCLIELEIEHRPSYNTRHTCGHTGDIKMLTKKERVINALSGEFALWADDKLDDFARELLAIPPRPAGNEPYGWLLPQDNDLAPMSISEAGINLIKKWEGFRGTAYLDPVGIWTIGYGHTQGVKPGQVIS